MVAPSFVYDQALGRLASGLRNRAAAEKPLAKESVTAEPIVRTIASSFEGSLRDKFRLGTKSVVGIPSASEGGIVLFSPAYYAACAVGGILSCGGTHMLVTPLDVVKCNMQTDPKKYTGIMNGFSTVAKEQGLSGLVRAGSPPSSVTPSKAWESSVFTSSSRSTTLTSLALRRPSSTRPSFSSPVARVPNSSPTSCCAPSRPSRSRSRPSLALPRDSLTGSPSLLLRRATEASSRVSPLCGEGRFLTP